MSASDQSSWSIRPDPAEYNVFYGRYVDSVPDGDLVVFLSHQLRRLQQVMAGEGERVAELSYAENKWTVRQVMGHILDTEWVFGSRLLRMARGDGAPLPGMDHEVFMAHSYVEDRSLAGVMAELSGLRTAVTILMDSLRPDVLTWQGTASGFPVTVRAQGWILAGHCEHHMSILKKRYDLSIPD